MTPVKSNYKAELDKLVESKKKGIPTLFSETSLEIIFSTLEYTPQYLTSIAKRYDDRSSLKPIMEGKRSFRETIIHLLNFEGLNYTTVYAALLLNNPNVYPIHAERDFNKLNLFSDFELNELLSAFCLDRKKYMNFLKSLKKKDWLKELTEKNKTRRETIYSMARRTALHDFTHVQILNFQLAK